MSTENKNLKKSRAFAQKTRDDIENGVASAARLARAKKKAASLESLTVWHQERVFAERSISRGTGDLRRRLDLLAKDRQQVCVDSGFDSCVTVLSLISSLPPVRFC
jgi:hypothetical protein